MTKSIEFTHKHTTSGSISSTDLKNERDYYLAYHGSLFTSGLVYRFGGSVAETNVFTREIKSTRDTGGTIKPGAGVIIKLGGPFEEIGGDDEAIGGDAEKVD